MPNAFRSQLEETLESMEPFRPSWMFRNGHVQTLAGMYVFGPRASRDHSSPCTSTASEIVLSDGDRLIYQDDCPADWKPGNRVALLLHGLSGSHASPYVSRIARFLNQKHVRTFRLDWRGCGAGIALARYPYHSGRSDDLFAAITELKIRCPSSPITVVGFSLSGNITLKLLGEARHGANNPIEVDRAIAVCPPIDLSTTVKSLRKGLTRLYDRYFCRALIRDVRNRHLLRPDAIVPSGWYARLPGTLYEFDDTFTAPVSGFDSAADYYAKSSSNQFLAAIRIPTLIIAAQDDPVIPFHQFQAAEYSPTTKLAAPRHGGHLGFCTPLGQKWLNRQIVEWAVGRL